MKILFPSLALVLLAACSQPSDPEPVGEPSGTAIPQPAPASSLDALPASPASASANDSASVLPATVPPAFRALGTEPFWSASVKGATLTYSTPESPDGIAIPVRRTERDGKAVFAGTLDGKPLELEVGAGNCSDGMSDTVYPLTVVRRIGPDIQRGCAR
ncbi:membrane protein-like protein [Novosphingobium aromaticivorans DSM 12444]|uniref:Membrane protein-like protein n=1 Tax=Novosphingobium aromaticivorans (strain ATCC 700278 / DSM 12444 / CCUG 56034 / CIP 105152 / NBRC 16084 / F199) TaxID=279238 RepID=Q2GAV4_NOVAD|nr:hypothetical protein [Novosphingobium aromaticivorans]ABD25019.1 membrane protein-like protein [Novosphingobium aromaticivorans DSM 12444]SCY86914.1 hypothetical protein SAMN05660666_03328 [Novosphingobium aromaticivorans]